MATQNFPKGKIPFPVKAT